MILEELNEITNDYFLLEDGSATDIYFTTSFLVDYLMKQQNGLWERPNGGKKIRVPLEYDESEGGWYQRNDPLSSDDREIIDAAYFAWKHVYGNATIYRTDSLYNAGEYAEVQLVTSKVKNAQKTARNKIAKTIYSASGDAASSLTGLLSCCSAATTTPYGEITEDGLVAADGTKRWKGNVNATGGTITLDIIRTIASEAKIHDGTDGKPNLGTTTEVLFNKVNSLLQTQQRYVKEEDSVKAGFLRLVFEGKIIAADDYVPTGYYFNMNGNHIGFGIHAKGYFARTEWMDLQGPAGQTMKVFWDGNMICNHRLAQGCGSGLTPT